MRSRPVVHLSADAGTLGRGRRRHGSVRGRRGGHRSLALAAIAASVPLVRRVMRPDGNRRRDQPLAGRGTGYGELRTLGAAVQPLIPAVDGQDEINDLQAHVGVQARATKHNDVEADVDDRGRPAPDVLTGAEIDAHRAGECGGPRNRHRGCYEPSRHHARYRPGHRARGTVE